MFNLCYLNPQRPQMPRWIVPLSNNFQSHKVHVIKMWITITQIKIEIKRNNKPPMQHLQATIFARLSHLKNFQFTIKRGEISKGPGIVEGNSSNPNSCDRCHMTAATILLYVSNFSYQG